VFTDLLGLSEPKDPAHVEQGDGWSSTKDVDELAKWLMFDIVSDLCFGKNANVL
jgi:hypothetical protein